MNHPSAGQMEPCRVLCIDDNHDAADLEALMLCTSGFDARACYDGATAITEARRYLPKVCLIDLHMPGMDGDELAFRLKNVDELKPLKLVAITAMCNESSKKRIASAGFHAHMVKPVDPKRLIRELDALCKENHDDAQPCDTKFIG